MVGLDFSEMDRKVLEYTKMVSEFFKPEAIYFVHAEEDLDLDAELLADLNLNTNTPADEQLDQKLEALVGEYFQTSPSTEIHCQVVEGAPFKEMLHWSHIKQVDLLIVGKKNRENGKGVLPQKLTRKIDASVLFVPEDYAVKAVEGVLVPIDFSKNSKSALETVDALFAKQGKVKVTCGNCFSLPMGWHKTGKSSEEFMAIMKSHAEKKYEKFKSSLNLSNDCDVIYSHDPNQEPSDEINEMAHRVNADLIVIGARGKTDVATVILGSTTEKLLAEDKDIPMLVVKQKGQTLGFLDALFKMK